MLNKINVQTLGVDRYMLNPKNVKFQTWKSSHVAVMCLRWIHSPLYSQNKQANKKKIHHKFLRQFDQIHIESLNMTNNGEVVSKDTFHHTCLSIPVCIYTTLIHDSISILHSFLFRKIICLKFMYNFQL